MGGTYEFDRRNSVGVEFGTNNNKETSNTSAGNILNSNSITTSTDSRYQAYAKNTQYSLTANYIHKIDSLGSTFKILADFNSRIGDADNDYNTLHTTSATQRDTLYRSYTGLD